MTKKERIVMNQSQEFQKILRRARDVTDASVVKRPVIRKRPVKDAIYGAVEPKKKVNVQNKVLSDRETQAIWNRNMKPVQKRLPMKSKTAAALASMQLSASPQRLPPVPVLPIGRPTMTGILSSPIQASSNPMWRK